MLRKTGRSARALTVFAFVQLAAIPAGAKDDKIFDEQADTAIAALTSEWLSAQRDYEGWPSVTAAVIRKGEIVYEAGFGFANPATGVKATPDTIYSICSISKLFTAVAAMELAEAGKISVLDPVQKHLPWFTLKQGFADSGPITIEGLLSHSSGLPREVDTPYWTAPEFHFPSKEEVRSVTSGQTTLYPARTQYQYSNLGLTLVGEIVEAASGEDYDAFVRRTILDPLGMKDTTTAVPASLHGTRMAVGYGSVKRDRSRDAQPVFDAAAIGPAAGFASNVKDLAKFALWQQRLLAGGGKEIIESHTLREMMLPHWVDPDWTFARGLGFRIMRDGPRNLVGHGGSCPGYRTTLLLDADNDLAATVMINAAGASPERVAARLMGFYREGSMKAEVTRVAKAKGGHGLTVKPDLGDYIGIYNAQPWGDESYVGVWRGDLAIFNLSSSDPVGNRERLHFVAKDQFVRLRDDGTQAEPIVFERDTGGKVVGFIQHSNRSRRVR
ncbi:serine hydrolase domain-containing protein [Pseudokordiimonas caeni]|uniref:serine hydrolase domain-containing protein n=1 Tax=Pseudokordiimonas caeni TaxID=2997908 RepID=UPI002810F76B|nr:serine hydrolase domain-containing protein [Pseudokordiimonas caeni]